VPDTSALSGTSPAAVEPAGAAPEPDADALADADVAAELDAAAELAVAADEDAAPELAGAVDAPPLPLAHAARTMLTTVSSTVIRHHEPCFFAFTAISLLYQPDVRRKSAVARIDMGPMSGIRWSNCTGHKNR